MQLVYGGASVGLMGRVADAALAAGGRVVGVIPERIRDKELAHKGLTELVVVESMAARKDRMAALSDAFVALPGGLGTLDELFEMMTWNQLAIHVKRCGLLDVGGFYGELVAFLDGAVREGFVRQAHRDVLLVEDDAGALLDRLAPVTRT